MPDLKNTPFADKLGTVFQKTLPKLAPDARREFSALLSKQSLAIIATVLAAWVVGHFFGIGEAIDIIIGVVGVASIGLAVFAGLDELYEFGRLTYSASSEADLDSAADHLAKAIAILGVQAALAVMLKGLPRTNPAAGRPAVPIGPEPVRTPGIAARPSTFGDATMRPGTGATDAWGNIRYSTQGTPDIQKLVLLHEKVHQFLTPKLYPLRRFRVQGRMNSYIYSSLSRYIEEMAAETVGQVGAYGFSRAFAGVKFPVREGYVYWMKAGADPQAFRGFGGKGVVPEGAALIASGMAQGMAFRLFFKRGTPGSNEQPEFFDAERAGSPAASPQLPPLGQKSAWPSFR